MKEELQWHPATTIQLMNEGGYSVTSVAFVGGWVLAKNENGTVAFPASQVVKIIMG